jgi:hypothetical protein
MTRGLGPHHLGRCSRVHQCTPSLSLIAIDVGRQDFTTCLLVPPPSLTWDMLGHPVTPPRDFLYRIGSTGTGVSGGGDIYCLL